jgi:hypothetical protein
MFGVELHFSADLGCGHRRNHTVGLRQAPRFLVSTRDQGKGDERAQNPEEKSGSEARASIRFLFSSIVHGVPVVCFGPMYRDRLVPQDQ